VKVSDHLIRIIYLGKKGGGLSLLEDFLTNLDFRDRSCELWLSSTLNSENLVFSDNQKVLKLFSPKGFKELANPRLLLSGIVNLLRVIFSKNARLSIFLMPSPFDWIYYRLLRAKKQKVVTCIHDLKSHPGERWPTSHSTSFRLNMSDFVIAFSSHVATELHTKTSKKILVAELPKKLHLTGSLDTDVKSLILAMESSELPKVLLIGRQRKYKDSAAFLRLANDFQDSALFIIAGEGLIQQEYESETFVINRWLSNREFMEIISKANIIFFPYSEASQSGNIPIAISEKKIIVATLQPGLVEQLSNYPLKLLYDGDRSDAISLALADALELHAASGSNAIVTHADHLIPLSAAINAIEFELETKEVG
jgi:hypothetical protein